MRTPHQPSDNPLLAMKNRISQKYLGRSGIHAVGVRRTDNVICLYYRPLPDLEQLAILEEAKGEAHPFTLLAIPDAPAELAK